MNPAWNDTLEQWHNLRNDSPTKWAKEKGGLKLHLAPKLRVKITFELDVDLRIPYVEVMLGGKRIKSEIGARSMVFDIESPQPGILRPGVSSDVDRAAALRMLNTAARRLLGDVKIAISPDGKNLYPVRLRLVSNPAKIDDKLLDASGALYAIATTPTAFTADENVQDIVRHNDPEWRRQESERLSNERQAIVAEARERAELEFKRAEDERAADALAKAESARRLQDRQDREQAEKEQQALNAARLKDSSGNDVDRASPADRSTPPAHAEELSWGWKIGLWLAGLLIPAGILAGSHAVTQRVHHYGVGGNPLGYSDVPTGERTQPMPILGLIWIVGYFGYWLFYGWWN